MIDEVPLSMPDITDREIELVVRTLRSGRLSIGPMQETFEAAVAKRTGRRHAIACSSGTAGLHMALIAMGIGEGDEVITTPFSFVASANSILYTGATPVFVDIETRSLNMDPVLVERAITPKTKAILAVEVFGNPTHMDLYRKIADRNEIRLIEDCCEGLGGSLKGRPIGKFGHAGVFGFYPNKQITTGEGGMVVTDDDRIADLCRSLRNQGRSTAKRSSAWLHHERLGFNYRLDELSSALGVAQMNRLDEILERRSDVANRYISLLLDNSEIIVPTIDTDTTMSWFVFVCRLASSYTREERDRVLEGMRRHDVGVGAYFPCIHLQPFYRERFGYAEGSFPIAESISSRTIALPFFNALTPADQDFVVATLDLMLSRESLNRG